MEVDYPAGSIVWVKLEGGRWWPGEVTDDSESSDVTKNVRKQPLAVVKFFDEECFHEVKSKQHIYPFHCDKKEEFVKRGKDFKMSGKDSFSLRLKFEADVAKAESLCKPPSKPRLSDGSLTTTPVINVLKGTKCASYMKIPPAERFDYGANREERASYESYVTCHSELGLARIRKQPSTPKAKETAYACDTCGFQTTRMENFIRHHKSHSDPYRFHPGIESQSRYVLDKLAPLKSRKKLKDGSRSVRAKRPKKNKSKNESPISRKRKSEGLFGEGRLSPKKKKNRLSKLNRQPFSNPFEDDEQVMEEAKAVLAHEDEEEEKQQVLNNDDDLDMDSAMDEEKPVETTPVEWEEFIKDTPLKGNNVEKSTEVVDKPSEMVTEEKDQEEEQEEEEEEKKMTLSDDVDKDDVKCDEEQQETTTDIIKQDDVIINNKTEIEDDRLKPNGIKETEEEEEEEVEEEEEEEEEEELVQKVVEFKEIVKDKKEEEITNKPEEEKQIINENGKEKEEVEPVGNKQSTLEEELEEEEDANSPATSSNTTPLNDGAEVESESVDVADGGLPETLLALSDEMQSEEMLVDETEEIVVTEGSLHAAEIMVGEEIEVQEIEIQSDGMSGGEIVLGDEVVMQLLPDDHHHHHHSSGEGAILDPMVPHSNTESISSNVVLQGEPVLLSPALYTSDHSLMAATPVSKQVRANSNTTTVYSTHPYSTGQIDISDSSSSVVISQQQEGECSKGIGS